MRAATLAALVILLGATQGFAFDPSEAEIIGLRLGMSDTDIAAALRRQGFAVTHDHEVLLAKTLDGGVAVLIGPDHAAHEIRYTLRGKGLGEGEKIMTSVLDRFGPPNQPKPMAWCRAILPDGKCPAEAASLTFRPDTLTLMLRSGVSDRN
jgi:hypothetical protein